MTNKYEVHLLEPVAKEYRANVAQGLAEHFRIAPEKMARVLGFVGIITKPLSQELAHKVADILTQAGAKAVVLEENLSEVLLLDQETPFIDKEGLKDFLSDIPSPLAYVVPPYVEPSPHISRTVVWGVLSLLFLILTLTFGVSFTHVPSAQPVQAQHLSIQPKHEVFPIHLAKMTW